MKKILVIIIVLLIGYLILLDFNKPSFAASAQEKVQKWRWVGSVPKGLVYTGWWEEMVKEMVKKSGGRLQIDALHLGQHPYKGGEMLSVIRDGLSQMGESQGVYVSGEDPFMTAMDLPFLIDNLEVATRIKNRWIKELVNPYLETKWKQRIIASWLITGEGIHGSKLLSDFTTLKGSKIRVWSKETSDLVTAIGATPVTISSSELYPSLEKKVIDGLLTSIFVMHDFKMWEVAKYSTWWDFAFMPSYTAVNLDAFNKLPKDMQNMLMEVGNRYQDKIQQQLLDYNYKTTCEGLRLYGTTVTGISPTFRAEIRNKCTPIWDQWLKRTGDIGHKFMQIVNEETKGK